MGKKGKRARKAKENGKAWDTAAARAPDVMIISGASGTNGGAVNGTYDRVPERTEGGASVYERRRWQEGELYHMWLFLASSGK